MLRGRTPRKPAQVRQAVSSMIENLESRMLMTTLRASSDQQATFDYLDENLNFVHIQVTSSHFVGEFLAARVAPGGNVVIRDLIPYRAISSPTKGDGANLFNVYIAEASADTSITITTFTEVTQPTIVRTYHPYDGGGNIYRYRTNATFAPDGGGGVYIGAQVLAAQGGNQNVNNIPITIVRNKAAYGVRPASTRGIVAGIDSAPGISLSKLLIGGIVTGHVSISGSLDTFYAGNVYTGDDGVTTGLITGTPNTVPLDTLSNIPNNFFVGGDLHYFIVDGSVGAYQLATASPAYTSGFQMKIGGNIGYARIGGNYQGSVWVVNNKNNPYKLSNTFHEIEPASTLDLLNELVLTVNVDTNDPSQIAFLNGYLDTPRLRNDNDATKLFGASMKFSRGGQTFANATEFTGILGSYINLTPVVRDVVDNYAITLLAGQTVTITMDDGGAGVDSVGMFDPLGNLVASDYGQIFESSIHNNQATQSSGTSTAAIPPRSFQYTAKIPGSYRLAVADTVSATSATPYTGVNETGIEYTLRVENLGNMALGGLTIAGNTNLGQNRGVQVDYGDLGSLNTSGHLMNDDYATTSLNTPLNSPINALRGNLREIFASNDIGTFAVGNTLTVAPVDLLAPNGSVGYLRSETNMYINASAIDQDDFTIPNYAIGKDYQRVEVGAVGGDPAQAPTIGQFNGNLVTNGRIGTVVCRSMTGYYLLGNTRFILGAPAIYANADNKGEDGTIDLIDDSGDFGSTNTGGPMLKTGLGGNVKYIRVLGTVYRDRFFGGSFQTATNGQPGQVFFVTDDSGARARLAPTTTTTTGTNGTVTTTTGALTFTEYGVRESGGVVLINCTSSTSIEVTSLGGTGTFDMTNLTVSGGGSVLQYNQDTNEYGYTPANGTATTPFIATPPAPYKVLFHGANPINVFNLSGNFLAAGITDINNFTTGEMPSMNINGNSTSLGYLNAQSVGILHSSVPGEILVRSNMTATGVGIPTTPLNPFSFGIFVSGAIANIGTIYSREDIGSIAAQGATSGIGLVQANSDLKNNRSVYEGIKGVIVSSGGAGIHTNSINKINVGEGLAYSGSGSVMSGTIYGEDEVNQVVAINADIRGTIASGGGVPIGSTGDIRDIEVTNGSLIGAQVRILTSPDQFNRRVNTVTMPDLNLEPLGQGTPAFTSNATGATQTAYSLGTINVRGNGGILASTIYAADFKAIRVKGGFGIVGSSIFTTANNNPDGTIDVDGLGIRNTSIDVGGSIDRIVANGRGERLSVLGFSPTARLSSQGLKYDPFSGELFNTLDDLDVALGTSNSKPRISGATNAGMIINSSILGSSNLGTLQASYIGAIPINQVPLASASYPMRIAIGNSIRNIRVLGSTNGLQLRTGRIESMGIDGNMAYTDITTAGYIKLLAVGGNVRGTSKIVAKGPQGQISTLIVKRALNAPVTSDLSMNVVQVGSLLSSISTLGSINNLSVTGDVVTGSYVRASKKISTIRIGGDFQAGATIKAKVFGTRRIAGDNLGSFIVG